MYRKPSAPRSIRGVLDDGFDLGFAGFSKTWPLALAAQILVALPMIILKAQFGAGEIGAMQAGMIAAQSLQYALAYLALVLVSAGFQNAITAQNAAVADGIARSAGQSLSIGFRLLPRTVLLGILLVLGFMLIAICFAIPGYFVEHSSRVLLVALYCVPLCFYLGRVFLANAIFVVEDLGAYASLLRSWQLTKNNYWRTAAVLAVLLSIFAVLVIVLALLTGFISAALGAASPVSVAVVQLIQAVGNTLFTPFISAILLSIYYDLRLRNGNLTYTGTQEGAEASQGHDR